MTLLPVTVSFTQAAYDKWVIATVQLQLWSQLQVSMGVRLGPFLRPQNGFSENFQKSRSERTWRTSNLP